MSATAFADESMLSPNGSSQNGARQGRSKKLILVAAVAVPVLAAIVLVYLLATK